MIAAAVLFAVSAVPTCRTASPELEALIAREAAATRMTEYCQFRRYDALDDVDGDGRPDFLVLFTLEGPDGGNDHAAYLAAFLSSAKAPLVVEAGRRGERDPVAIEARRGEIRLDTLEYLPKDPMCCPSGKGVRVYRLEKGRLAPVSPSRR